jgi:hypothetical protein
LECHDAVLSFRFESGFLRLGRSWQISVKNITEEAKSIASNVQENSVSAKNVASDGGKNFSVMFFADIEFSCAFEAIVLADSESFSAP